MKSLLLMPMTIAAVFGVAAIALALGHIAVNPVEPIIAGAIASAAGVMGLLPVIKARRRDPVGVVQSALMGTMLHLLVQIALAVAVISSHAVGGRRSFPLWLLGGYWTSLVVLIWQLRRIIAAVSVPKIPE
jgi:hypothetical protein